MTLLHHYGIYCTSVNKSLPIYLAFLGPLGFKVVRDFGESSDSEKIGVALGAEANRPELWLFRAQPTVRGKEVSTSTHLAYSVPSKDVVDQCHQAALSVFAYSRSLTSKLSEPFLNRSAGATDNGAPGLRKYMPGYYGELEVMMPNV